jgi:uncharacterized membrane protein
VGALLLAIPAAALAWVALLVVAPLAPAGVAAPIYLFGSFICHQIADRSFHIGNLQLPVCARCFGIYVGAAVGCLLLGVLPAARKAGRRRTLIVAACIPTAMTVVLEWGGLWRSSNIIRALAGLILGAGVAFALMAAIHYERWQRRRPLVPPPPSTPI